MGKKKPRVAGACPMRRKTDKPKRHPIVEHITKPVGVHSFLDILVLADITHSAPVIAMVLGIGYLVARIVSMTWIWIEDGGLS